MGVVACFAGPVTAAGGGRSERYEIGKEGTRAVDIPELCKTCKYCVMLSSGVRCRKKTQVRYREGKMICIRYRRAKRFGEPEEAREASTRLRPF